MRKSLTGMDIKTWYLLDNFPRHDFPFTIYPCLFWTGYLSISTTIYFNLFKSTLRKPPEKVDIYLYLLIVFQRASISFKINSCIIYNFPGDLNLLWLIYFCSVYFECILLTPNIYVYLYISGIVYFMSLLSTTSLRK